MEHTGTIGTPCYCWDYTLKYTEEHEFKDVKNIFKKYCKKWCFQKEKGESGYIHWQCRISLTKKTRNIVSVFITEEDWFKKGHWSPTTNIEFTKGNNFYVMKEQTRIEGPWSDKDKEPRYIPRDIKDITLWDWQTFINDKCKIYNERKVNFIFDATGNNGKTRLVRYICTKENGLEIPFCNDFKDIMRMGYDLFHASEAHENKNVRTFIIDMPRAVNKEKLFQMFGAIEKLKDGYAYDDRYSFKYEYFDPPNVIVFANKTPDRNLINLLSRDRWNFYQLSDKKLKEIRDINEFTKESDDENITSL